MTDSTKRFSDRVANYVKYRPGYPGSVYTYLQAEAGLKAADVVADIGSGTGLSSLPFLEHGHRVYGIEPNTEMRAAVEQLLAGEVNFVSLAGTAEKLPLPDSSVDFVLAGQAFHWFEPGAARREMARVLRTSGQVALIWNTRDTQGSEFQQAYENLLLTYGTDFKQVDHQRNFSDEKLAEFFAPQRMRKASFAHRQTFDFEGLRGRLLSSSYAPIEGSHDYAPLMLELKGLFEEFEENGKVSFLYQTKIFHGRLK